MTYPSQDDILSLLAAIKLPDTPSNLVELGLLADLSAEMEEEGLHIRIVLEIDPAQAESMVPVRDEIQKQVEAVEGVARAAVILSAHKKAPSVGKGAKAKPPADPAAERHLPDGVRAVIAVASAKGGVGKSTTAVNLALALAKTGLSVGLLDADVYGPSLPRLLGLPQGEVVQDEATGKLLPMEAYGLACMSIGLLVPENAPMIWRGPMVHGALKQMLHDVAWGARDVLILDMPPGTGDASLSVAQHVPLAGAVIVSTPQDIALLDVRKGIAMFQKLEVPVLGLIENMSYFECPHCHGRTDIFGHGGARADAEKLGLPFLGEIPLDLKIRETSDSSLPIVATAEDSPQAAPYIEIAKKLAEML
ncbi:MAG: Mrp/NBP35 family ATP-binding protein [Alphaproteobacteria bacterium]|nr:Mrp/NBP35 family ATP-binding protein [Alphaproteobacteria bacterium]